jgi:hypothetical protein
LPHVAHYLVQSGFAGENIVGAERPEAEVTELCSVGSIVGMRRGKTGRHRSGGNQRATTKQIGRFSHGRYPAPKNDRQCRKGHKGRKGPKGQNSLRKPAAPLVVADCRENLVLLVPAVATWPQALTPDT